MKKSIYVVFLLLFSGTTNGQDVIQVAQWSNQVAFENSSLPAVRNYGVLSDSLKQVYGGISFYEYGGNYYPIQSWADYYYWFTQKYWYRFSRSASIYEMYYFAGDNLNMAQFISGNNYLADVYPSACVLAFSDPKIQNRMNGKASAPFSIEAFEKENAMLRTLAKEKGQTPNVPSVHEKTKIELVQVKNLTIRSVQTSTSLFSRPGSFGKASIGASSPISSTISPASKN